MGKIVKRALALIGTICALWIIMSGLFFGFLCVVSLFKKMKQGHDAWTEMSMLFYSLPVWGITLVVLLATYAILYIIKNQKMIAGWFDSFFDSIVQEE